MAQWLSDGFDGLQQWLFESLLQPLMFSMGWASFLEDGYAACGWLLVGLLQLGVIGLLIGPLQRLWPVEPVTDRATIRTDILYTLVHRLGLFRLGLFATVEPLADALFGALRVAGVSTFHLDGVWPGVSDVPWVSLLLYLLVLDFFGYWIHRAQHHFEWWWRLHSLHHAQRQMTMWSDSRNHLLDDLLRDALLVAVAQFIGVMPGQFIAIVAITQLSENLQHANLRLSFGRWGERLWISPRFHRLHHGIGIGHETTVPSVGAGASGAQPRVVPGGANFGVLLPWWDMLMRSANFDARYGPTGVRDQVEPGADGRLRDYGQGFWSQQWRGVLRLFGRA
ncbi:fatty acid hydroxylase family protein [Verminephrobacter aporrectodeae subsp. tuberculatae]|uniref:sterol desaturase family protein n=1 Tax=Verminephrobacter aporrectodeae TaxID=1110389 RepID=UPI002238CDD6|nr:sterol desaturase family protein [Verminephrobacter aporrectodeae]MCW5223278.1 fatty acid hydroxylase family protein [Verminephrobacter aporrectodeae subsp. tuberculatae]MCW5256510.1 fatty acid hydroxylase family protein [Verminephrobacter aporrectodeae subsp. tuberculatae]MCW5288742.1 fatty acid hydroxylase family protein [Verminephrobacter aporrectodeae subsp. tuberculatae]